MVNTLVQCLLALLYNFLIDTALTLHFPLRKESRINQRLMPPKMKKQGLSSFNRNYKRSKVMPHYCTHQLVYLIAKFRPSLPEE